MQGQNQIKSIENWLKNVKPKASETEYLHEVCGNEMESKCNFFKYSFLSGLGF